VNRLGYATAGVVMVNGKKELQVCGGKSMARCQLWTDNGWVETATGFDRTYAGASTVGGSMIVTGGLKTGTRNFLASSKIYTAEYGWLTFTSLPVPKDRHCQVTVGDSVYVVGGRTNSADATSDTYRLDLPSRQWIRQASLNTPRQFAGCAEWDDGIIVVGGFDGSDYLSSVEKYDPVRNKWIPFTPLPKPLNHMQVLVWGNDLYVFGGSSASFLQSGAAGENKNVYKLNKADNTWETLGVTLENTAVRNVFPAVSLKNIHCN